MSSVVKCLHFRDSDSVGLVQGPEFTFQQVLKMILMHMVFDCHWLKGRDGDQNPKGPPL